MRVRVTFEYEPDESCVDGDHAMGITEEEYDRLVDFLVRLDAEDVEVVKA